MTAIVSSVLVVGPRVSRFRTITKVASLGKIACVRYNFVFYECVEVLAATLYQVHNRAASIKALVDLRIVSDGSRLVLRERKDFRLAALDFTL